MEILYLTGITTIPNEAGEDKIAKATGKKSDSGGLPPSWYRDQGLKPPVDDEEDYLEFDEEGRVILKEDDLEEVNIQVAIPLHLFAGCEDLTDGTTIVYTTYGYQFTVEECVDEITSYVEYLSASWWTKTKASIIVYFKNLKWRKNNN